MKRFREQYLLKILSGLFYNSRSVTQLAVLETNRYSENVTYDSGRNVTKSRK